MRGPRFLVVALLVGSAVLAAAQSDGGEYLEPEDTECWECHAPGLWNPDMDPNFELFPLKVVPEPGQPFELRAELLNAWLADQEDMFVTLDLRRAPSLGFVGGKDPSLGVTSTGSIVLQPAAPDPDNPGNLFATGPSRGNAQIVIPESATAIRVTLTPQDRDPVTGPDLTMRVYNARTPLSEPPSAVVNQAGKGASEVYALEGAATVGSAGFGNWTIQAEMRQVDSAGSADPQPFEVPFTVTVDAWFNATEATQQVVSRSGPLQPGAKTLFTWQLQVVGEPQQGEVVDLIANVTSHYVHDDRSYPDYADITINTTAPVRGQDGQVQVGIEQLTGAATTIPAVETVGIDRVSEIIGYVSAVLLLLSIWTGGMFGKASRRQLNVVFGSARRRVAFHNFLSYGIIVAAIVHTFIFIYDINGPLAEDGWPWLLGILWGSPAILGMVGLGVTGAIQVPMIRRWNYATWRWTHFGLAILTMVFTLVHMLLDGQNFVFLQNEIGYSDPLTK